LATLGLVLHDDLRGCRWTHSAIDIRYFPQPEQRGGPQILYSDLCETIYANTQTGSELVPEHTSALAGVDAKFFPVREYDALKLDDFFGANIRSERSRSRLVSHYGRRMENTPQNDFN
jgi:hypothetical protein